MIQSPCIKHCSVNIDGVCNGCLRTRQEITDWRNYSDEQKREVLEAIKEREKRVNGNN